MTAWQTPLVDAVYVVAIVVFTLGSVLCGLSSGIRTLILFRGALSEYVVFAAPLATCTL